MGNNVPLPPPRHEIHFLSLFPGWPRVNGQPKTLVFYFRLLLADWPGFIVDFNRARFLRRQSLYIMLVSFSLVVPSNSNDEAAEAEKKITSRKHYIDLVTYIYVNDKHLVFSRQYTFVHQWDNSAFSPTFLSNVDVRLPRGNLTIYVGNRKYNELLGTYRQGIVFSFFAVFFFLNNMIFSFTSKHTLYDERKINTASSGRRRTCSAEGSYFSLYLSR